MDHWGAVLRGGPMDGKQLAVRRHQDVVLVPKAPPVGPFEGGDDPIVPTLVTGQYERGQIYPYVKVEELGYVWYYNWKGWEDER